MAAVSTIGSASMSALISTVRPGFPPSSVHTAPVSVGQKPLVRPMAAACSSMSEVVSVSKKLSSG